MDPITVGWMISSLLAGYIGNRGDHFICKGTNHLYRRIKERIDEPTNHHIQKAIRKSYLQATFLAVEYVKNQKYFLSQDNTNLGKAKRFLKKEILKTESEKPLIQYSTLDNKYREILFPKEGFSSEERLPELIQQLKDSIIAEFRAIEMPLVDDFIYCIYNGWEENGKKVDFYQLTCAFFTDELKKNPILSTIIQTEYLDETSAVVGSIDLKITGVQNSIEAYYESYKVFIPKVVKILETVEEIRDDVKEIKETQSLHYETLRQIADAINKNTITQEELVASDNYQKFVLEIERLKGEIEKTVYQIKGVENALAQVDESTKSVLQQNIENLENQLNDKNKILEEKESEFDRFIKDLLQLAQQLSKTKDIESERLEKARILFQKGKYDEVNSVLNEKQIDKDIAEHKEKGKILAAELTVKAQTIVISKPENWFEDTCHLFEMALDVAGDDYNTTFDYAYFLAEHKEIDKAIELYTKTLSYCTNDVEKVQSLNNIGSLQADNNDFNIAEISLNKALKIYKKLADKDTDNFLPDVANALNLLGALQFKKNDFESAEVSFGQALENYQKLVEKYPNKFLTDVAQTLNNLGSLQIQRNDFENSEISFNKVLEIYQRLASKNPDSFLPDIAIVLNNIGSLHSSKNDIENAIHFYQKALEIRRELAQNNPYTYLSYLADTLNNIGAIQVIESNFESTEIYLNEALEIRKKLADKNPEIFLSDVADTLGNLGMLQSSKNDFDNAETSHIEALKIKRDLAKKHPETYLPSMSMILNNLGNLQARKNDFDNAEISYIEALEIRRKLAEKEPESHLLEVSRIKVNLALLYTNIINQTQSVLLAQESIEDARPFVEFMPIAQQIINKAEEIIAYWSNSKVKS